MSPINLKNVVMKEREGPQSLQRHSKLFSKEKIMYKSHFETLLKLAARLMNAIMQREKAEGSPSRIPISATLWSSI